MSEPFTRDQVIAACRALGLDPRRVVDLRIEPRRVTVVTAEPVLPIRRVTTVHPIATDGEVAEIDNGIREPQAASWQDGDLVVRVDRDESFLIGRRRDTIRLEATDTRRLLDLIDNALRWLDRRIGHETDPASIQR